MRIRNLSLLLSVLGVLLTVAGLIASVAQYRAADLQARAAINQLMPQIEVTVASRPKDDAFPTDHVVVVESQGGPVLNLRGEYITWLELERAGKPLCSKEVAGYFGEFLFTGKQKGEVLTISGARNLARFAKVSAMAKERLPIGVSLSEPRAMLTVSYLDSLREQHTEYYLIRGSRTSWQHPDAARVEWSAREAVRRGSLVHVDTLASRAVFETWLAACGLPSAPSLPGQETPESSGNRRPRG